MTAKEIMKKAVKLAKTFVGDWVARMALALKFVWREAKATVANESGAVRIGEKERGIRIGRLEKEHFEYGEFVLYEGEISIGRETEKAIEMKFAGTVTELTDAIEDGGEKTDEVIEKDIAIWLPKSQCRVENDVIIVPLWLVKKNYLGAYIAEV
jgi:hypothetical protein